jgi:hypothetical protein
MVARIYPTAPFKGALRYNENKLKREKAVCIHAGNFPSPAANLNFYDKLKYFERIASLNQRTTNNGLHISLNFDPSEKIDKNKMEAIAKDYMEKIGFGEQPFLVYQHNDAGHPHLHIVSILIQEDGKRKDIHDLGRTLSEPARKQIEEDYKLIKANGKKQDDAPAIKPVHVQKALYGKTETKQAISNVLHHVISNYKFTSLAELNAVLKQFNVVADRGKENSRVFKHDGLNYFMLDEKGNKIGVPIKASLFYFKPTLKNLEKQFPENKIKREPDKQKLKNMIDWVLASKPQTLKEFAELLIAEKIHLLVRQNENGLIYGLTFIDYRTKSVFNGSDIGKGYSAKNILAKLQVPHKAFGEPKDENIKKEFSSNERTSDDKEPSNDIDFSKPIGILFDPLKEDNYMPFELKNQNKKKKRSPSHKL